MRMISLQSGSAGNCTFVEANGVRLLFDAGISGRQMDLRLAENGFSAADVDALIISHDHHDHIRCMGVYHRRFGLPVYLSKATWPAAARFRVGRIDEVSCFESGSSVSFGDVTVHTICTPHDGTDGVGFVVDDGEHRLGILTDLGHVFDGLADILMTLDGVLLESNYDQMSLETGAYPEFLKARIRGLGGHISNDESAELLAQPSKGRLKWVCLGHLSEENNDPAVALATHRSVLGDEFPVFVADRYGASGVFKV